MPKIKISMVSVALAFTVLVPVSGSVSAAVPPDSYGLFDPSTGIWHLYEGGTEATWFYYGNPGDYPFMGDWDGDGVDTPGLYRQSDGFAYLKNDNSQGNADVRHGRPSLRVSGTTDSSIPTPRNRGKTTRVWKDESHVIRNHT